MLILGIESSAKAASCALVRDGALIGQYFQCSGLTHSATLLPMAENLLASTGTDRRGWTPWPSRAGPAPSPACA